MEEDKDLELEALVAQCLQRLELEGDEALESVCSEHPDRADTIRRRLARLRPVGAAMDDPDHIGPYRILKTLGEGGMGTVYLAEQSEPVRRHVALKVIKRGMETKQVLLRFEAERQALAMMEHDSIARVFDCGTTEDGLPFFVMEYVRGEPISTYCDRLRLSTRDRVALFQTVCGGVQHAHHKGVIHRDLKPGNVLVSESQGRPVVKIIDFGLARATNHDLVRATVFTQRGQFIGTPEYMSPEQAGLSGADIDTRTDVYSLGVMLYEILVGELPFTRDELRGKGLLEVQRKIREDDPPRPSTKLVHDRKSWDRAAGLRRSSPASLVKELRGELDWVVLTAMAKDRDRRYGTANELAADLGRFLAHEPITARPPSLVYRSRKYVRKHRIQVTAGATVVVALLTGLLVSLAQMQRAREEAKVAQSTTDFLVDLFRHAAPDLSLGEELPVKLLLRQGEQRLRTELMEQPAVRARLLGAMGLVHAWLEADERSVELLDEAIALRTQLEGSDDEIVLGWEINRLAARFNFGETSESADELEVLQDRARRSLGSHHQLSLSAGVLRASFMRRLGQRHEARRFLADVERVARESGQQATLDSVWTELGKLSVDERRYTEARDLFERALVSAEDRLPPGHPRIVAARKLLYMSLVRVGAYEEAENVMERLLEETGRLYGKAHPTYSRLFASRGHTLSLQGRDAEAVGMFMRCVEALREGGHTRGAGFARLLNDIGAVLVRTGDYSQAASFLDEACDAYERAVGDHLFGAICLTNLADAQRLAGDDRGALESARASVTMVRRLQPEDGSYLSNALVGWAEVLIPAGRLQEAETALEEALAFEGAWPRLAHALLARGYMNNMFAERGRETRRRATLAREDLEAGLSLLREGTDESVYHLATGTFSLGWSHAMLGNQARAEELMAESAEMLREQFPDGHPFLAFPLNYLGGMVAKDRPEEGIRLLEEALAIRRRFLSPDHYWIGFSLVRLGSLYVQQDRLDEAEPILLEAYPKILKRHGERHGFTTATLQMLVKLYEKRGMTTEADEYRDKMKR